MAGTVTALRVNDPRIIAPPPGFWNHQREAFSFLADKHAGMLAMGMGTGKSCVSVALLEHWNCSRVLLLCPKSVAQVWPGQFAQHGAEKWRVVTLDRGTTEARARYMREVHAHTPRQWSPLCVVLNYDVLTYKPLIDACKSLEWDALVCDEVHKLKSPSGKQSRIVSQIADRTPRRLGLTGTPMPHSPLDVYGQFRAIDKSVFGTSFVAFRARYAVMGGFQNHEVKGFRNLDDLHARMYRITFRCRSEDVLDLPPFIDVVRTCTLSPSSTSLYERMEKDLVAELEGGTITADNALVKLLRLAQITGGHVKDDEGDVRTVGTEKAELLADVLEEITASWDDAQEPVVVFARFHHDLDTIHAVAARLGLTTGELSGRRNDLADWQAGGSDVLVVQLQSGGVGIDLTRARYCVYYSHEFSLGNYEQSRARVHRPGQTRPVTYIHLVAENTVDQTIRAALDRKAEVVRFVVDDMLTGGSR